ncbi:MAG TPA: hypothetical protein VFS20_21400 [Longimicrobium sp.]|nr:hypothetical protein [Longimicrobium sp.]
MLRLTGRFSRLAPLFVLSALAACADRSPVSPVDGPEPATLTKLSCTVQVRASSLTCTPATPTAGGARGALYVGGQGVYVRLTSSGVSYNAGTGILSASVTVQNLLGQPIGTTDGVTADTVRVFFESGPTRTAGSGSVEVANEDGSRAFTQASQPYFDYPGILATEQTSAPQEWQFSLPNTVETFVFTVYVAAPVPDENALQRIDLDPRTLAVGGYHSCALTTTGQAYCWGSNTDQQTGSGASDSVPVPVSGGLTFKSLTAGRFHTCGITTADAAYCWGDDETGQLGAAGEGDSPTPLPVSGGMTWLALDAGAAHTCGITTARALYCWGDSEAGQLGAGDSASTAAPVAVTGGRAWASVDAGADHTCGVTRGGAAFCWGDNGSGELGRAGSSSGRPVLVSGNRSWRWVSAGENFSCGITSLDVAMCWGTDEALRLGNGNGEDPSTSTPTTVSGGLSWSRINAGRATACGVTTTGAAYCWGFNNTGEIGDGGTTYSDVPVAVQGGTGWAWVDNGEYHACGIRTNGEARCWGYNDEGQLGDNTTDNRPPPAAVSGGHTWDQ